MGTLKTDLHAVFDLDSGGIFYTERAKTQSVSFKILRRDQRDANHPVYSLYLHRCNRKREYDSRHPILFAGVAAAFLISYTLMKNMKYKSAASEVIFFILLLAVGGIFILFTFSPPLIPLFEDSITKTYGI